MPNADSQIENMPGVSSRVWLIFALGLVVCAGYLMVELGVLSGRLGFPLDDSWIHLQFARNLASGEGLSYNPGVLVTGSTAPLWTALLSIFYLIPGDPLVWTKLTGIVLYLLGGWVTYRLAAELDLPKPMRLFASALTLLTSWLVWSALSGLEIPLFVVLSIAGICLHIRERADPKLPPTSLAVLGVSILVRPEALLLVVLAIIDRLLIFDRDDSGVLTWVRPVFINLVSGLLMVLAVVIPVAIFNYWVTGSVLPTTFSAKTPGVGRFLPEMRYLYTTLGILMRPQPVMVFFCGAGILALVERIGRPNDRGLLPALWLVGLPVAYSSLNPPTDFVLVGNFGRYFFPLFPVLVVLGVLGMERALQSLGRWIRVGRIRVPLRSLIVVLIFLPTVHNLVLGAGRYAQNLANVHDSDVVAAEWLASRLDPAALLAVVDIGALKYMLPNPVVDLAGIANPEVHELGYRPFLERHRPDYLVIFPDKFRQLLQDGASFELVHTIPIPNNITMGGSAIGIYTTPWTRFPLTDR